MTRQSAEFDVVAVGAHPDDIEIACGGTLAKLTRLGYRVAIVDLTDGEPTPRCEHPDVRRAEAQAAAEVMGVHRVILPLPNRRLFDSFEARVLLATEFRKMRPRLVIGLGQKTPLASPDHYQAMLITDAAVFYSRLSKWDQHFPQLAAHTITSQLYIHLGFEHLGTVEHSNCLTVDISEQLELKLQAISCYQTQFPPERHSVLKRVEALARSAGAAAGFAAGEVFYSPRAIGCQDLVAAVVPDR
ncbi:MAG: PIG-L family deacetylase [Pirellulaceae bacterium]|nr:PIG-L family deacetylase [Pirellulaceae bacterium]